MSPLCGTLGPRVPQHERALIPLARSSAVLQRFSLQMATLRNLISRISFTLLDIVRICGFHLSEDLQRRIFSGDLSPTTSLEGLCCDKCVLSTYYVDIWVGKVQARVVSILSFFSTAMTTEFRNQLRERTFYYFLATSCDGRVFLWFQTKNYSPVWSDIAKPF